MRKQVKICLVSAGLVALSGVAVEAEGLKIGGDRGISVDVDTRDGLGARASVGGSRGLNAGANVGTRDGLTAEIDASLGGSRGLNASVGATVGGSRTGADVDIGIGDNTPGNGPGTPSGGGLTAPQRQAFQNMSPNDRRKLLVRCASINSGGYDAQLVELCRLLRLSAAR